MVIPPETPKKAEDYTELQETKKTGEDTWSIQKVWTSFPQNAVKAPDQPNSYVALCYYQGAPVMGRAWNDSGIVCCEFAVNRRIISDSDVEGLIQLLLYEGTHETNKFYYEWIPLSQAKNKPRKTVRSGSSIPIFWQQTAVLGNYNMDIRKASFPRNGRVEEITDFEIISMMKVLIRNTDGGPPNCPCNTCSEKQQPSQKPLKVNEWCDVYYGIDWPGDKPLVKALGRPLKTSIGDQEHFVALFWSHGRPLLGRAWIDQRGKLLASFTHNGREITGEGVNSLQILVQLPATVAGFDYIWLPYEQASKYRDKDFAPLQLCSMCPCVLKTKDNYEVLGQVDLNKERAEAAFYGEVVVKEGPEINNLLVLCRKDRNDTFMI